MAVTTKLTIYSHSERKRIYGTQVRVAESVTHVLFLLHMRAPANFRRFPPPYLTLTLKFVPSITLPSLLLAYIV